MYRNGNSGLSLIILVLTLLAMIFEEKIGIKLCISGVNRSTGF
ncbi:MAG: hypothetical protein ACLUN4_11690 [Lachnospiraceae bacterium]